MNRRTGAPGDEGRVTYGQPGSGRPFDGQGIEPQAAPAYAWAEAFYALRGKSTGDREEREADRERIACLEAIIATLIEKNECGDS